jgi:hypothetical protein
LSRLVSELRELADSRVAIDLRLFEAPPKREALSPGCEDMLVVQSKCRSGGDQIKAEEERRYEKA